MIFLVSGYRRSGTSACMRALQEGLLEGAVAYQPGQEGIGAASRDGYTPNPSGLLEVGQYWYMRPAFLREVPDGTLFKCLYDGLPHLPRRDWTIFFMRRDPREIAASCARVDKHLRQSGVQENAEKSYPFDCFRPYRQDDIDHVLGIMDARTDVRLVQVQFRDMIERPLETFSALSALIPIDPEKAAAVVEPKYHRFKSEELYGSTSESGDARASASGQN